MDLYTVTNCQVITMLIIHTVFTKCSSQLEENTYLSKNKRGLWNVFLDQTRKLSQASKDSLELIVVLFSGR